MAMCESFNGQMLTIRSAQEMKYIRSVTSHVWLGYVGGGTWQDGTPAIEPSEVGLIWYEETGRPKLGDCITYGTRSWAVERCSSKHHAICEVPVTQWQGALNRANDNRNNNQRAPERGDIRSYVDERLETLNGKLNNMTHVITKILKQLSAE